MTPESVSQAQLLFNLILLLTTVGNSALIVRKLFGKSEPREITPQPLQISAAPVYATRSELAELAAHLNHLREEMRDENAETRLRIDNLPDRIIAILRNTGAIK